MIQVMSMIVKSRSVSGMRLMNRQVACADVILLNKTDLVDEQQLHEVEDRIRYVVSVLWDAI